MLIYSSSQKALHDLKLFFFVASLPLQMHFKIKKCHTPTCFRSAPCLSQVAYTVMAVQNGEFSGTGSCYNTEREDHHHGRTNITDLTGASIRVWMRSPEPGAQGTLSSGVLQGFAAPKPSSMPLEVNALECGNLESWIQEDFLCVSTNTYCFTTPFTVFIQSEWKRDDILHWKHPTHTQKCGLGLHTN